MVRFEKDRFIIDVYTGYNPVEDWMALQNEIAHVFGIIDQENIPQDGLFQLSHLLSSLQPDWETAKKMTQK